MRSTELYRELVDHLGCGVFVVGSDHRIAVWNDRMSQLSRISEARAVGARVDELLPHLMDGRVGSALRAALTMGRSSVLSCAIHRRPVLKLDTAPPHAAVIHAMPGPPPRAMVVLRDASSDIDFSERFEALHAQSAARAKALRLEQDRLHQFAQFDPLTGLANRHKVRHHLQSIFEQHALHGHTGAVLMLDIDRFADINCSAGTSIADEVLRGVASRLIDSVRPADTVARLGGDKFVVVLERIRSVADAEATGRRLLHVFDAPFVFDNREIFLTASVGLTVFSTDQCNADRLLTNVETAVGRAKKEGGGGFQIYRGGMDEEVSHRLMLHAALRHASENGEFKVVYQPQVAFPGNIIVGVEALLRWSHPVWGPVSPLEFVPILEESGMIVQVGEWVLREACRQGRQWRQAGLPSFRVSVNVSTRQFRGDVLQQAVAKALADTEFPASDLELEVTESMLMNDVESSDRMLSTLKRLGVRVAIDDFGTGYSSLSYLRRFPVDTLKIDRDFTRNIATCPDDRAICETIITLGNVLQLDVLAEGVETESQLDRLRKAGCNLYQGFFFGRPMAASELGPWMAAQALVPDDMLASVLDASRPEPAPPAPVLTPCVTPNPDASSEYL